MRPIALRTDGEFVSVQEFKKNVYNMNGDLARNSLVVYQDDEMDSSQKHPPPEAPATQKISRRKKAEFLRERKQLTITSNSTIINNEMKNAYQGAKF